jgi:hypothetical protein
MFLSIPWMYECNRAISMSANCRSRLSFSYVSRLTQQPIVKNVVREALNTVRNDIYLEKPESFDIFNPPLGSVDLWSDT